jgi:hypothetical protein
LPGATGLAVLAFFVLARGVCLCLFVFMVSMSFVCVTNEKPGPYEGAGLVR